MIASQANYYFRSTFEGKKSYYLGLERSGN